MKTLNRDAVDNGHCNARLAPVALQAGTLQVGWRIRCRWIARRVADCASAIRQITNFSYILVAVAILAELSVGPFCLFANEPAGTTVTVEVLIFSGRPNPRFQLQDFGPLEELRKKISDQPQAFTNEPPSWTRLGFAGFRIHGGEALGLADKMRIYEGVIQTGHGRSAKHYKDAVGLEAWLVKAAGQQPLEQAVKDAIVNYGKSRETRS